MDLNIGFSLLSVVITSLFKPKVVRLKIATSKTDFNKNSASNNIMTICVDTFTPNLAKPTYVAKRANTAKASLNSVFLYSTLVSHRLLTKSTSLMIVGSSDLSLIARYISLNNVKR